MKIPKMLFVWLVFGWTLFLGLLFPTTKTYMDNAKYYGFSMDGSGNLYVAKGDIIEVVTQSGEPIRVIDLYDKVGYTKFTIADDILYLDAGDKLYVMDTEGTVLECVENYYDVDYSEKPKISPRKCVLADGTTYVMRNPLLRSTIYRLDDGSRTKVYQMPAGEYAARLLIIVFFTSSFLFFGPYIIWKWYKLNPELLWKPKKTNMDYRNQWTVIGETSQMKDSGSGFCDDSPKPHSEQYKSTANARNEDNEHGWKSIPKWIIPVSIVFFVGCIVLARLAVTSKGYMIGFLAWAILCCTAITFVLWRRKKK